MATSALSQEFGYKVLIWWDVFCVFVFFGRKFQVKKDPYKIYVFYLNFLT